MYCTASASGGSGRGGAGTGGGTKRGGSAARGGRARSFASENNLPSAASAAALERVRRHRDSLPDKYVTQFPLRVPCFGGLAVVWA